MTGIEEALTVEWCGVSVKGESANASVEVGKKREESIGVAWMDLCHGGTWHGVWRNDV